jgi:DNA-binding beta-propeller fold protein YncE
VLQTVTGTSASGALVLNRHGSQLWEVAGNQVSIINTATYEVINNLTLSLSPVDTTESGLNAVFTSNGKNVYITAQYSKTADVKTQGIRHIISH